MLKIVEILLLKRCCTILTRCSEAQRKEIAADLGSRDKSFVGSEPSSILGTGHIKAP